MANDPGELQEEFLSAVRKSQETVIEAIKTWVETVQSVPPAMPSVPVPGTERLPKPEEVVADAYNFTARLLASQRQFAEEILKTTSPLLPGDNAQQKKSSSM